MEAIYKFLSIAFLIENLIIAAAFFGPKGFAWLNKNRKKEN